MISIILIEPETSGNVGAIARSMANFNLKDLILINPKCNHLDDEAKSRSKHGLNVLKNTQIAKIEILKEFDTVVATTAALGLDYNIKRSPLTPKQLTELIKERRSKTAIVFGRESTGLSNEELKLCEFTVTIPASKKYPVLNISHSATVLFYELFQNKKNKSTDHFVTASQKEKEVTLNKLNDLLDKLNFTTEDKKDTQKLVWKRLVGKSMLTKREAYALLGFVRKVEDKIK